MTGGGSAAGWPRLRGRPSLGLAPPLQPWGPACLCGSAGPLALPGASLHGAAHPSARVRSYPPGACPWQHLGFRAVQSFAPLPLRGPGRQVGGDRLPQLLGGFSPQGGPAHRTSANGTTLGLAYASELSRLRYRWGHAWQGQIGAGTRYQCRPPSTGYKLHFGRLA